MLKLFLFLLALVFTSAHDTIYISTTSSDWMIPQNWYQMEKGTNKVPGVNDLAVLNNGYHSLLLSSHNQTIRSFIGSGGSRLYIATPLTSSLYFSIGDFI